MPSNEIAPIPSESMASAAMRLAARAQEASARAYTEAAVAQSQIAQHERTCSQRWAAVFKLGVVLLLQVFAVLGMLLYDKFF